MIVAMFFLALLLEKAAQKKRGIKEPVFTVRKMAMIGMFSAIAMILQRARILLISDLPDDLVRSIFLEPCHSIDEALAEAYKSLGEDAKAIVMPYGGSTLPVLA